MSRRPGSTLRRAAPRGKVKRTIIQLGALVFAAIEEGGTLRLSPLAGLTKRVGRRIVLA